MTEVSKDLAGLILSGGDPDGERFEVLPWQRQFLRASFREPSTVHGIRPALVLADERA